MSKIIHNAIKTAVGISLLCYYTSGFAGDSIIHHFNFGHQQIKSLPQCQTINHEHNFNQNKVAGFVSGSLSVFDEDPTHSKSDKRLYDGVHSDSAIEFRFKAPAGVYWFEILMSGGKYTDWKGEISVNKSIIADSLNAYHTSVEGEAAPAYWTLIRKAEVVKDIITIRIDAKNQKSTLCGVSVYPDKPGPLRLVNGEVMTISPLSAPNSELILQLINQGAPDEAERILYAIPNEFRLDKAYLLLALSGRLEINEPRHLIELAVKLLQEEMRENPSEEAALNLKLAQNYIIADLYFKMAGWDWAKKYTREGIFGRLDLSGLALDEILQFEHHPLYYRAMWAMGKLSFWGWVEQQGPRQIMLAEECFKYLHTYYPDHRLLKMYMGERIAFHDEVKYNDTDPLWAQKANYAIKNLLEIIHYWVQNRQAENGEFGGKYDDDVEMLRWWPVGSLVAGDSITMLGLTRLVNGMWNSDWLENGFSKKVLDVEHSSEPVADTQPMMIGIDYGNPIYVERCMESIQGLENLWTGINEKGHRHFKSSWYSATEIDQTPPKDCDVPYNTRTVKAARWLAWYNRHPVAMKFLKEWGDSWLEDCLRTDKHKPYGIVPSAIRYHDDAIGGHADNWHHPGLFWTYYNFHGGIDMMMQFLSNYVLFEDPKYLEPIELAIQLAEKYYGEDLGAAPWGSEQWVAHILNNSHEFSNLVEQWRLITGDSKYDDFLLKIGSDYLKFRLTGDEEYLVAGCEPIIDGTIYNRELITTEGYFTDRIDIKNIRQGPSWGANHLEAMFTGKTLSSGFYPFSDLAWQGMGNNFSAVVLESGTENLKIMAYNLAEVSVAGSIHFWNLKPGSYSVTQGPDKNNDRMMDQIEIKQDVEIDGPSQIIGVNLPARERQIIEINTIPDKQKAENYNLPDLAITHDDIRIEKQHSKIKIVIPVHNIGLIPAENFAIHLLQSAPPGVIPSVAKESPIHNSTESGNILKSENIVFLDAPLDLKPRIKEIKFELSLEDLNSNQLKIVVNPRKKFKEISSSNNEIIINM
jgi:hypothetical protein